MAEAVRAAGILVVVLEGLADRVAVVMVEHTWGTLALLRVLQILGAVAVVQPIIVVQLLVHLADRALLLSAIRLAR